LFACAALVHFSYLIFFLFHFFFSFSSFVFVALFHTSVTMMTTTVSSPVFDWLAANEMGECINSFHSNGPARCFLSFFFCSHVVFCPLIGISSWSDVAGLCCRCDASLLLQLIVSHCLVILFVALKESDYDVVGVVKLGHKNKLTSKINELRASSQQFKSNINVVIPSASSPQHQQFQAQTVVTTTNTSSGSKCFAAASIPLWVVLAICVTLWIVAFSLLGKGLSQVSDCDSDYRSRTYSFIAYNNWQTCLSDAAKTLIGSYVCFALAVIFCCITCCVGACTGLCCLCCWGARPTTSTTFISSPNNSNLVQVPMNNV
jgi:hypothetical protein